LVKVVKYSILLVATVLFEYLLKNRIVTDYTKEVERM